MVGYNGSLRCFVQEELHVLWTSIVSLTVYQPVDPTHEQHHKDDDDDPIEGCSALDGYGRREDEEDGRDHAEDEPGYIDRHYG